MQNIKDYSNVNWSELVYYDETSPSCIRWKVNRLNCSNTVKATKGSVAGSISDKGYWIIPSNGTYYKVHRIVWLLANKTLGQNEQIDHINRQRNDNRLSNLRKVDYVRNRRNISKQQNNTSGVTGVKWWECRNNKGNSSTYAVAQWQESGKKFSKNFSVKKFGLLPAFAMACKYREDKIKELNAAGYGYSDNHGK